MRNLNKVILINSANGSVPYCEVSLDGNVHFIGTQGVGKSTLLRVILFFYNADKMRLGISKEKKSFDEYYFPYQNSFIIYEVLRETGAFCVMAFKSQGRVAFRFIDAAYQQAFFIDVHGQAFDTQEKVRDAFGKKVSYSKIINNYEEYRNIIYGNNQMLTAEFRKYAVVESKQYQNIPRTIQNVFLNAKLEAEFIKETIIKSLNEEEIKIDLTTYSHSHLKDVERNLNDIKKWVDLPAKGEQPLRKLANDVATIFAALQYLGQQKIDLAKQLAAAWQHLQEEKPLLAKAIQEQEADKNALQQKLSQVERFFYEKEKELDAAISVVKNKLKEIREKEEEYAKMNISEIFVRVAKKEMVVQEKQQLNAEHQLLTADFAELTNKYEALLKAYQQELAALNNGLQSQINALDKEALQEHTRLTKQYEDIFEAIRNEHAQALKLASNAVEEKKDNLHQLEQKRSEIRFKPFYETEIRQCKEDIVEKRQSLVHAENTIKQSTEDRRNKEREWDLELDKYQAATQRNTEKHQEAIMGLRDKIGAIEAKIKLGKDSLFGWLNEQMLGWEHTIGKLIDEQTVLFQKDLNPKKVREGRDSFFGLQVDVLAINKSVKSIADYQDELKNLADEVEVHRKAIDELQEAQVNQEERLKKRFQPAIGKLKYAVKEAEYAVTQLQLRIAELQLQLSDWEQKATADKKTALQSIDLSINQANEALLKAQEERSSREDGLNRQLDNRRKERDRLIKQTDADKWQRIQALQLEHQLQKEKVQVCIQKVEKQRRGELESKGADTIRINAIETRLIELEVELKYIDAKMDVVARYRYDEERLFQKQEEFKAQRNNLEKQLVNKKTDFRLQQSQLLSSLQLVEDTIRQLTAQWKTLEEDTALFTAFQASDVYLSLANLIFEVTEFSVSTTKRVKQLVDDINKSHYKAIDRQTKLQETINKFVGHFNEDNLFSFKTKFVTTEEYLAFAEVLKEFIDENKLEEYIKRVNERFANIIHLIGKETGLLIAKEGEIHGVISDINKDFGIRNFAGAIKSIELRTVPSANKIFQLLVAIKQFNDENTFDLGAPSLFSSENKTNKNEKAIDLLKQLMKEMGQSREREITLSDSFELQFRIVENDNDTNWVEKLANVGSDGTDILVKAMINIMLLNVFKERAAKKQKTDFILHCMMDEIGKLHPNNVKGILKFANDRNIYLINSSPTSFNAIDYKYTYLLAKESGSNTTFVKRLVRKIG